MKDRSKRDALTALAIRVMDSDVFKSLALFTSPKTTGKAVAQGYFYALAMLGGLAMLFGVLG